jgi:hypothetical protein
MSEREALLPCPFCGEKLIHNARLETWEHPAAPYTANAVCPAVPHMFHDSRQDCIAAWNRRRATPPAGSGWRTMESAPKDDPNFQALACHQDSAGWWAYYIINRHDIGGRYECWVVPPGRPITPTHWRPLPAPPAEPEDGK